KYLDGIALHLANGVRAVSLRELHRVLAHGHASEEGVLLQFYTGGSHCHSAVTQRGLRKAISQGRRSLAQARVFRYRPRLEALCCAEKARVISRYAELLGDAQRAPTRKTDKTRQSLVRLDK